MTLSITKKKILLTLVACLNLIYIVWRIFFTLPTNGSIFTLFFAWGLLLSELLGLFELFVTIDGTKNQFIPKLPKVNLNEYPNVDVFIATYNEDVELVRKTVVGCKNMVYPGFFQVFICDDGRRSQMKQMAYELDVHYITRDTNQGAKAGNLNNALKQTKAPLIVTFDADMIPKENFLMETVPYFMNKEDVKPIGFVQTPQSFYNPDLFQHHFFCKDSIPNEQDYFYRHIQTTKNHSNTVVYGGSNTVLSRVALEDVGGFYEGSITEDFATGILIQNQGYQCYAISKVLASGLSPHDMKSLFAQRERWARGCIQTIKRLNLWKLKGLSFKHKMITLSAISYWYSCIKRFFYIAAPIAFTVFGIQVVDCSLNEVIGIFLPTYLITNLVLNKYAEKIRTSKWTNIYETILFPTLIKSVILETFGITKKEFSVTDKSGKVDFQKAYHSQKSRWFYGYIILSSIGVFNVMFYMSGYQNLNFIMVLFWLVTNLGYLIMALLFTKGIKFYDNKDLYAPFKDMEIVQDSKQFNVKVSEMTENGMIFESLDGLRNDLSVVGLKRSGENKTWLINCSISKLDNNLYELVINKKDRKLNDAWNNLLANQTSSLPHTIQKSRVLFHDIIYVIKARRKLKTS